MDSKIQIILVKYLSKEANIDEIEEKFFNIDIYEGNVNNESNGSTILDFMENKINIIRQGDGMFNL